MSNIKISNINILICLLHSVYLLLHRFAIVKLFFNLYLSIIIHNLSLFLWKINRNRLSMCSCLRNHLALVCFLNGILLRLALSDSRRRGGIVAYHDHENIPFKMILSRWVYLCDRVAQTHETILKHTPHYRPTHLSISKTHYPIHSPFLFHLLSSIPSFPFLSQYYSMKFIPFD